MQRIRIYGTVCPQCKKSFVMGKVPLEDGAQLADLRRALAERGWTNEWVTCPNLECNAGKLCGPDDLIFLDYAK